MSLKKKYDSVYKREEMMKTKHVKTEALEDKDRLFPKRKTSDNVKYYTADKKKKSVSLYEAKKDQPEILAKYMYEHRKI